MMKTKKDGLLDRAQFTTVGMARFSMYFAYTGSMMGANGPFESVIYRISDGRILEYDMDLTLEDAQIQYQRNCKLCDDATQAQGTREVTVLADQDE